MSQNPGPPYGQQPPYGQPPQGYPPQQTYQQQPYSQPGQAPMAQPMPPGYQQPVMPYAGPGTVVCPRCGSPYATKVSFTWWGGMLGPRLLSHVKCNGCGFAYNAKTGKSNSTAITIYTIVGLILGIIVFFALVRMRS